MSLTSLSSSKYVLRLQSDQVLAIVWPPALSGAGVTVVPGEVRESKVEDLPIISGEELADEDVAFDAGLEDVSRMRSGRSAASWNVICSGDSDSRSVGGNR